MRQVKPQILCEKACNWPIRGATIRAFHGAHRDMEIAGFPFIAIRKPVSAALLFLNTRETEGRSNTFATDKRRASFVSSLQLSLSTLCPCFLSLRVVLRISSSFFLPLWHDSAALRGKRECSKNIKERVSPKPWRERLKRYLRARERKRDFDEIQVRKGEQIKEGETL